MSDILQYTMIEGGKCFSPHVAGDYPDGGFDLTDRTAQDSFWVRSRSRLFETIFRNNLAPKSKTKFLEIGCGTGNFIRGGIIAHCSKKMNRIFCPSTNNKTLKLLNE